jgi:class 3 adenylate cyclase/predicted ATPase
VDIEAWLRRLGLEQYAPAFRDNDIDAEVLPDMTADDLIAVGVRSVGHRRKLLAAIAALREKPAAANEIAGEVATKHLQGAPSGSASRAERRQLTVMFCDLVGSTALSSRLDPEDLQALVAAYNNTATATIGAYGGFVAEYMGDGVLAYFGYPQAHEDDAERALCAALELVDAIPKIETRVAAKLECRLGIATGLVVVDLIGSGEAQKRGALGDTPNLAARLQGLAEPNTVVIAEVTRRLVGDLFEYRELGAHELKGFPAPVLAFQVLGASGVASRFEALRTGATPLIGREEELELLSRRWAQAKAGKGQVVLISAEPGIGKSRLAEAFRQSLEGEQHTRLRYFCSPHHQDSALFPVITQLERAAGFERRDPPVARLDKLEALLGPNAPADGEFQLLAELLSVPFEDRYPAINLTPQRKKEKTFEVLLRQLAGLARQQPTLTIFEDLHWADPTSRELLDISVERVEHLPVLLIATFRPEFQPSWTGQPHVTTLSLRRLGRRESGNLIQSLIGSGTSLSEEVIDEILVRTDGVPLFVEELTKAVLEGAQITLASPASLAVPATLHASLMARLDRLGPTAKEIAQVGAAIGREFPYEVLVAASQCNEAEMQDGLGRLVDTGLLLQRGVTPQATFSFKHALVRDAAHSTLLRGARQHLHARIAEALEAYSPELIDNQPELLAQHYAEAGLVEKSVACWGKAGHSSTARSAMAEAAAQFQKGLDQLALLPETPERRRQELEFCSALGAVLLARSGYAAPETGQAYARARVVWSQLDFPSEYLQVPWGQWLHRVNRAELALALSFAQDLLNLSRQRKDDGGLVLGRLCSGVSMLVGGRFRSARSHLEEDAANCGPAFSRSLVYTAGLHPWVLSQIFLGMSIFCLGYPDQAVARSNAALVEARRLAHPPTLAMGLVNGTRLLSLDGDATVLGQWVDQVVTVTGEQGFPHWRAQGMIFRGWAKVKNGDVADGISTLRSSLIAYRSTGAELWMPYYLALEARAREIAQQIEEGLTLLDEALEIVERTGERWFAAELNRHKGQLLMRQGHTEAAEGLYRKALSIAEEQEAKLWELRAVVSLARLWRDQDRRTEARNLLALIYGWFTEGFDTPDLKEARALLGELG